MSDSDENFECVVIGSGFGGTIAAMVMANLFFKGQKNQSVCILERGQWWISHEIPSRDRNTITKKEENMREYLEDNTIPHGFWAHPDNIEGLFNLASMSRQLDKKGLYDFRTPNNFSDKERHTVSAITASGVGGGSLVYSNVTMAPPKSVFANWPTEKRGEGLNKYFEIAEKFIGVNKITTTAGISNQKLSRSLLFQNAAKKAKKNNPNILNADDEYDLKLSITDIPDIPTLLSKNGPLHMEKNISDVKSELTPVEAKAALEKFEKKYKNETNVCQRQGRCTLGCLPGARHTFNKKLFRAIEAQKPLVVKPLCEAYLIHFNENEEFPYTIHFKETEPSLHNPGADKTRKKIIKAKMLIVAGGSLSTTELLLKSKEKGLALSRQLGNKFTTNGDLLALAKLNKKKIDITRGPINTSHVKFKSKDKEFAFTIEDTAIPSMVAGPLSILFEVLFCEAEKKRRPLTLQAKLSWIRKYPLLFFMVFRGLNISKVQDILFKLWREDKFRNALLDTFGGNNNSTKESRRFGKGSPLKRYYRIVNHFITNAEKPFASPTERLDKFFAFSCMGIDRSNGELSLNEKWESTEQKNDLVEKLKLKWDPHENREIFDEILAGAKIIAKEIDEIDDSDVLPVGWNQENPSKSQLVLLHPLGGCPMGFNGDDGVVNSYGEVFRPDNNSNDGVYPYFLVIDGSIIPSSPGVNPSLTIAAIAIRCMEHLAQKLGSHASIEELLVDK